MTQAHHHHGGAGTFVEDRSPLAAALIVLAVVVLAVFLIWLFAFSGVVFDNSPDNTIITPGDDSGGTTGDTGGTSGGTTGDTGTTDGGGTMSSP